jgi:hypothetical protein
MDSPEREAPLFPGEKGGGGKRRLVFSAQSRIGDESAWLRRALENRISVLVIPLCPGPSFFPRPALFRRFDRLCRRAEKEGLVIERGGWDLTGLLSLNIFSGSQWRRMDRGKRVRDCNFCPTNPELLEHLKRRARRLFERCPRTGVFHLWPDRGHENAWCSCPACRAFSGEEQNLMAVSAAADALLEINPEARLSYFAGGGEGSRLKGRPNTFGLSRLPGQDGAERDGWFL